VGISTDTLTKQRGWQLQVWMGMADGLAKQSDDFSHPDGETEQGACLRKKSP
jgi:hypothetical protein